MAVPSGVIVPYPGTNASIPSGWTRVTALDARFVKQIATSGTAPGATGGAANHGHGYGHGHNANTHTSHGLGTLGDLSSTTPGTAANRGNLGCDPCILVSGAVGAHTHWGGGGCANVGVSSAVASGGPSVGTTCTTTADPPYLVVIFIKSDGTPSGIPNNALAHYNAAAPGGWTAYAGGTNRNLKGAATAGDGGGTGGTVCSHTHPTPSHTHSIGAHTHPVKHSHDGSGGINALRGQPGGTYAPRVNVHTGFFGHAHLAFNSASGGSKTSNATTEGTTGTGDGTPPWYKQLLIQNTSGSNSLPVGVIAMWDGALASIPGGWRLCDGTSSTPNLSQGKYTRAANGSGEVGNTGGGSHGHAGTAHTHTTASGAHTHCFSNATSGIMSDPLNTCTGGTTVGSDHTHAYSAGGASGSDCVGSLQSGTGTICATTFDPIFTGIAYIQFFSGPPGAPTISVPVNGNTYDASIALSATATDPEADSWASQWEYDMNDNVWHDVADGTPAGRGSLVASGAASTLLWTTSGLTAGTYRVRVKGIDPSGSNTYGALTTSGTFTISHNVAPNAPTLVAPTNNAVVRYDQPQLFDWTFDDNNVGDTQSAYALQRVRVSDGQVRYWRASDNTWQSAETWNTSGTDSVTVGANLWTTTKGEQHDWAVATKDQAGLAGPYSGYRRVKFSVPVNPTISDPTVGSPATIPTADYLMKWTTGGEQTKYRARYLKPSPGYATVMFDSGIVTDSASRQVVVGSAVNADTVRFELTTWNNDDLPSDVQTVDKTVSFTPPATPGIALAMRS